MTYQEKLEKARNNSMKKLFDNQIRITGSEVQGLRISYTEDFYGDKDLELISDDIFDVFINFPEDIPFNRYRADDNRVEIVNDGVSPFDLLPIECFYKWSDKNSSEKAKGDLIVGDLLLFMIENEDNIIPVLFQVSENLGSLRKTVMMYKCAIAPYNGIIIPEIKDAINDYINSYKIVDLVKDEI